MPTYAQVLYLCVRRYVPVHRRPVRMFAATAIASPSAARYSSEPRLTLRTPSSPGWATVGPDGD
ncbi:hypothetical protein ACFYWN_33025 [Streptomyces sp. NPDC002917]|uniref:hypothetical protein n=1 Tax=Streptomyces sp. NPDC002917 TaxID=3364671 RepID=UPI00367AF33B